MTEESTLETASAGEQSAQAPATQSTANIKQAPKELAPAVPAPPALVLNPFLQFLRTQKSFESQRNTIRVTPKGLFVEESAVDNVALFYQKWLEHESQGANKKPIEKIKKLLLGEQATRQYILEGKNSLRGYVFASPIQNPQQSSLPFFLGSLTAAADYLHPSDPELKELKDVEIKISGGNFGSSFELKLKAKNKVFTVSQLVLSQFADLAKRSHKLTLRYPTVIDSLAGAILPLQILLKRSRPLRGNRVVLVPKMAKDQRNFTVLLSAGFEFVVDRNNNIRAVYELIGKNLWDFIRQELARIDRRTLGGPFQVYPATHRMLGIFHIGRYRNPVHPRAFTEFLEYLPRSRDVREKVTGLYTIEQGLQKFISFFELAQPFDRRQFAHTLKGYGIDRGECLVCGGWTFIVTPNGVVERCIARHIPPPRKRNSRYKRDKHD